MIVWNLTGIPSPESFIGIVKGSEVPFYVETGAEDGSVFPEVMSVQIRCERIAFSAGGISLSGTVISPPQLSEQLALVDICWDSIPTYSGQIALTGNVGL